MKPALLAAAALFLAGCSSGPEYLNRDVTKVVVMIPFDMATEGTGNGVKAWEHVEHEVSRRGYALIPRADIENWYRQKKFTGTPEEIQSYTVPELCREFGVDAVVLTDLPQWGKVTMGIFNEVRVKMVAELIDKDGATVWKGEGSCGDSNVNLGRGKKSIFDIILDTAVKAAVDPEVYAGKAAAKCFRDLPRAGWDPEQKKGEPP